LRDAAWQTTDGTINATIPPEADIRFFGLPFSKTTFCGTVRHVMQYRSIKGAIYFHVRTYPAKNGQIRPKRMSRNDDLQSHRKGGGLRHSLTKLQKL